MSRTMPTIGFITPPAWFEPAVAEFPTVIEETVRVQQAPLLLPDFDFQLESIAAPSIQDHLNLNACSLKAMSCELIVQVGTPFAWAGTHSEAEARARCDTMQQAAGIPCIMTALAIVDGLRAFGISTIAINCPYYEPEWRDQFSTFMEQCGFKVLKAANLHDLGLTERGKSLKDYYSLSQDLTNRSFLALAKAAPDAEAIVIPGTAVRTLPILATLEAEIGKPIVAADTILYWAIAHHLGLTLKPVMGKCARLNNN